MIKAIKDAEEECLDLKKGRGYRQIVLWLQFSIREMNDESKKKNTDIELTEFLIP